MPRRPPPPEPDLATVTVGGQVGRRRHRGGSSRAIVAISPHFGILNEEGLEPRCRFLHQPHAASAIHSSYRTMPSLNLSALDPIARRTVLSILVMPPAPPSNPYHFGFTAASLRPELSLLLVEEFFKSGSWERTREQVLARNTLQCRSKASTLRLERELRQRLETLTEGQLALLRSGTLETRITLSWLATIKRYSFLRDVAVEVVRSKIEQRDAVLRPADYELFLEEKSASHPEIDSLSPSTRGKVRRVVLRMLREVGILSRGPEFGTLRPPLIPPEVEAVVRADDPRNLAAFLVPDNLI